MTTAAQHRKVARLAAGALLLAGERTERLIRRAAAPHIRSAARSGRDSGSRVALLDASAAMAVGMAVAIQAGRREARRAAARRVRAELAAAGESAAHGRASVAGEMARLASDSVAARRAAESLADQWSVLARAATTREESAEVALRRTERQLAARVSRTAVTEAARAYNDEHSGLLADAVRSGRLDPASFLLEWDAMADACERCLPLNGERVSYGEEFPGGEEPGGVHPHCACVAILIDA